MGVEFPVWRSMMFVPANIPRFVEKAHTRGADAYIVDLEDSVVEAEKTAARAVVQDVAATVSQAGADIIVRINRPWRHAVRDLEAAVSPGVHTIAMPKVGDAGHVQAIAEVCDELEAERGMTPGHTKLWALVETAAGLFNAREIAGAHQRLIGMSLGSEDFALDIGMAPDVDGLYPPTMECVYAARAAGIMPLGFLGSIAGFGDIEAFRALIQRSRALGFVASSCIHPAQVPVLNELYGPSADEVGWARRVIDGFAEAEADGRGSFQLDGKMIDIPIVIRAERLMARHDALEARAARAAAMTERTR